MTPPRISGRAGLTLAELLVALFVTALALGIVAEGARRALDMHAAIERTRAERETLSAGLNAARERLERAITATRPAPGDAGGRQPLFAGASDLLAFAAIDPGYPSRAGIYEYRLYAETAEGRARLILARRPLLEAADFGDEAAELESWPLLEGEEPVRFSYAGPSGEWRERWEEEPGLPALVRITAGDATVVARLPAPPPETEATANGTSEAAPGDARPQRERRPRQRRPQ
ncbi:MAG: hypothetical protein KIS81_07080 [Maricaulaceae bacterium]|nr:hypothetical protein [Maricaulaceae bacterium]